MAEKTLEHFQGALLRLNQKEYPQVHDQFRLSVCPCWFCLFWCLIVMSACFTIDDCIGIVKKKSFWKKIYRECLDWLSYWVPTLFENSRQFLLGSRLLRQQLTKKKNKLAIAKSFLPIDNSIYKLCKFETKSIQNKAGKWLKKKKTKNRSMNGAKKKNANTIDAHILLDFWPFCLRLRLVVFSE